MRITFKARPRGGLKLIEEIEDYPVCWLEGRNGVGKTLAVRLLELATGGQPYASDPAAWLSLRDNVGTVDIAIDRLGAGDRLDIVLTPNTWPKEPLLDMADRDTLGSAQLNGADIAIGAVRDVLRVSRIGGDETLTASLRSLIARDRALVARQNGRLEGTLNGLTDLIAVLFRPFGVLSLEAIMTVDGDIGRASEGVAGARRDLERAGEGASRMDTLLHLTRALDELRAGLPTVDAEMVTVEDDIERLEVVHADLTAREQQLAPIAAHAGEGPRLINRLNRLRERQDVQWWGAYNSANALLGPIGLPLDIQTVEQADIDGRTERAALVRLRAERSYPPNLRPFIDRVWESLNVGPEQGLDDADIAILADGRLTPRVLRDGLTAREAELRRQDPQVEEIDARLVALDGNLGAIGEALALLRQVDSAAQRRQKTERRIDEALSTLDAGDDYRAVVQQLGALDTELYGRMQRKAELVARKGYLEREGTEGELVARIAALRVELRLGGTPLDAAVAAAHAEEESHRDRLRAAHAELSRLEDLRNDLNKRLAGFVAALRGDERYAWLRRDVGDLLPLSSSPSEEARPRVEHLLMVIDRFRDGTDRVGIAASAVQDALDLLVASFDAPTPDARVARTNRYLAPLVAHYETQFGKLLATEDIQRALFDDGTFKSLDLLRREISWQVGPDETRRRPIEAFSSGERAFTYVLATVLSLQQEARPARNRLLVLDEFGAFIEADRLDRLLRFLQVQVLGANYADQVVIILPLHTRGDVLLAGDDARAKLFRKRGYLMYDKVPG